MLTYYFHLWEVIVVEGLLVISFKIPVALLQQVLVVHLLRLLGEGYVLADVSDPDAKLLVHGAPVQDLLMPIGIQLPVHSSILVQWLPIDDAVDLANNIIQVQARAMDGGGAQENTSMDKGFGVSKNTMACKKGNISKEKCSGVTKNTLTCKKVSRIGKISYSKLVHT